MLFGSVFINVVSAFKNNIRVNPCCNPRLSVGLIMNLNNKLLLITFVFLVFSFVYSAGIDNTYKYAWGENIGWVNFNPTHGNVDVSDTKITGYAWSENYGWINLSPTNGGVFNDGNGNLSGYAWGENLGWIDFSNVKIDPNTGEFSGYAVVLKDGSKINFDCTNCKVKTKWRKTAPPSGAPPFGGGGVGGFILPIQPSKPIIDLEKLNDVLISLLKTQEKIPEKVTKVPERINKIFEKPKEEIKIVEDVFKRKWTLLSYTLLNKPFVEFTLSPLPKEIQKLAEKFPKLEKLFKELRIAKLVDIQKLKGVKLSLPGLKERLGLYKSVPVSKLLPEVKRKIPTEFVFIRSIDESIDFNVSLIVDEKGKPTLKANFITGKKFKFLIKPEKSAKSIKGYIVFKSKKPKQAFFEIPRESLLAFLFFKAPVLAESLEKSIPVEEKLVLAEFEYKDYDKDGIWEAEVQMPKVEGEYEIITVIDYENVKKAVKLIAVIDPEGYVYEKYDDKEIRIPGAVVSLFWLNPETKKYELWPANEYSQENPQITDVTGSYAFLVPPGYYYLKVEAPGYFSYIGKPFYVKEGSGVNFNIELKSKYWMLKVVDWKTILLIMVVVFLLYNFYSNKIREEIFKKQQ
jgi:hypothetical protein